MNTPPIGIHDITATIEGREHRALLEITAVPQDNYVHLQWTVAVLDDIAPLQHPTEVTMALLGGGAFTGRVLPSTGSTLVGVGGLEDCAHPASELHSITTDGTTRILDCCPDCGRVVLADRIATSATQAA